jgi:DNA-directed RNA polymerase specialized sigma24 family protein
MVTAAVGLRPQLLLKALELANGNLPDAEDLVQDAYLKFVAKPPAPRGPAQLRNWLRTVLRRRWIDLYRLRERDRLGDVASLDELL